MDPLGRAVLSTLSYFSCFSTPLTAFETWRHLLWESTDPAPTLGAVEDELARLCTAGNIRAAGYGFYSCNDSAGVADRLMREADAVHKWRIVRRGAALLSLVPFLEGVAVVNTLSMGAAHPDSDIDVLILAKPGRMFLVRLGAVLVTSLFGLRRHGHQVKNRLCLSFFLTAPAFDLERLAKYPDDPYLRFWATSLVVVVNKKQAFERLWQENAAWLAAFPHAGLRSYALRRPPGVMVQGMVRGVERLLAGSWGDVLERVARGLQERQFRRNVHSRQSDASSDVVVSSTILKFHENDRRIAIRDAWYARCAGLGIARNAELV